MGITADEPRVWGIHTQDDHLFLAEKRLGIGWKDFGDLSKIKADREDFKEHCGSLSGCKERFDWNQCGNVISLHP